jgi:hypothetical protein
MDQLLPLLSHRAAEKVLFFLAMAEKWLDWR